VRHRDAETTRNKLRTNKSHLQIVGQNRMNGSVRITSVLFQLHDGHSSIKLNQMSHFFNQRNSGNFLTALRTRQNAFLLSHNRNYVCLFYLCTSYFTFTCCDPWRSIKRVCVKLMIIRTLEKITWKI